MTKYSAAILDIIEASTEHLTAEEIFLRLKTQFPKVVLASVYNNLNRLYAEGCIRKVTVEGFPDRYDKTVRHDHLVCAVCGKLSDLYLPDLTEMLREQSGVNFDSYDLKLRYVCPSCLGGSSTAVKEDRVR